MIKQFNGIRFYDYRLKDDEVTIDESQVCEDCVTKFNIAHPLVTDKGWAEGAGVCGVQGCAKKASRYIEFPDGELVDLN